MSDENERQVDLAIPENERHPVDVRIEEVIPPVEGRGEGAVGGEEEGIESLREQLAKANERAATADRLRQQREAELSQNAAEVERLRQDGGRGQLHHQLALVDGELTKLNGLVDNAVAQRTEALQQGDFAKEAQINRAIAAGEARLFALQNHKGQLEHAIKNGAPPPTEGRVPEQQQRPQAPADPVEAMIQGAHLSGRSADWVRAHPEVATNARLQAKVGYAHQEALAEGHADGSDGYFAAVDKIMGFAADGDGGQAAQPQRRPAMAAPVSPSSPGGGRQTPRTVRLSPEQREAARISGISEEAYARNWLKMQAADASTRH